MNSEFMSKTRSATAVSCRKRPDSRERQNLLEMLEILVGARLLNPASRVFFDLPLPDFEEDSALRASLLMLACSIFNGVNFLKIFLARKPTFCQRKTLCSHARKDHSTPARAIRYPSWNRHGN